MQCVSFEDYQSKDICVRIVEHDKRVTGEKLDFLSVSEKVGESHTVSCHADLHQRQLLCEKNQLAALIDFGEASILISTGILARSTKFILKNASKNSTKPFLGLPEKHQRLTRAIKHIQIVIAD